MQRLKHLEREASSSGGRRPRVGASQWLAGKDLESVVFALGEWSVQWLYAEMEPRSIDPITLTWWMHHRVDAAALPPGRVVVQFDYTGPERVTAWIVLDRGEASVCNQHPGYDSDVIVTCTSSALSGVFNGVESWSHALATGAIRIDGRPASPALPVVPRQPVHTGRRRQGGHRWNGHGLAGDDSFDATSETERVSLDVPESSRR